MGIFTKKPAASQANQANQKPKVSAASILSSVSNYTKSTKADTAWIRDQLESRPEAQDGPDEIDQLCLRVKNMELILNTLVEVVSNMHGDQRQMIEQQNEMIQHLKSVDNAFALISRSAA